MATLTISTPHDYSDDALSNIDDILFANMAVAIFASSQFTPGVIFPMCQSPATLALTAYSSICRDRSPWQVGRSRRDSADTITVNGSAGGDTIIGSSQADTMFAGDGSDTLDGGDGNDVLVAHTEANVFVPDQDTLNGGNGNDTLYGDGFDTLSGGAGFDVLQAINDYAFNLDLAIVGIEYVLSGFGDDIYTATSTSTAVEVYASGVTIPSQAAPATTDSGAASAMTPSSETTATTS